MTYLRDNFDQVIFNVVRSPDFNPIEGIFSKIKHDFKKNQTFDRTQVITRVYQSVKKITKSDVMNQFIHSMIILFNYSTK